MKNVYKFYNNSGWKNINNLTRDAELFEDNRKYAKKYVSKCRRRILEFIPKKGINLLDFASGPIQYKEYLEYSKNFKIRHCVDFSKTAIKIAKKKLRNKGKYYCKNILKITFPNNFFDCVVSLHTIYHINKSDQEKVIKKLLNISKKGAPVIIVYSNPDPIIKKLYSIFFKKKKTNSLYFYPHKLRWWKKFEKHAEIKIYCWRSFSSKHQKILFPNNIIGKYMLDILYYFETRYPHFFGSFFQYPLIILKKK